MIDTATEQVYSLSEFARELKKQRGIARDYSTIREWSITGWSPRGQSEPVVKLEVISIMGVAHTSFAAFERFLHEQAEAKLAAEMTR
jgi:hypothetical protein